MRIGIVGSRKRTDKETIINYVLENLKDDDVVVSGGCSGVDTWAAETARQRGLEVIEFLPNTTNCKNRWDVIRAYYARNFQIAAASDKVVAFVASERKGGTEDTIKHARKLKREIEIL